MQILCAVAHQPVIGRDARAKAEKQAAALFERQQEAVDLVLADQRLRPYAPTVPDKHDLHEDWATLGPALAAAIS